MRTVATHALVALTGIGLGYTAAPQLQHFAFEATVNSHRLPEVDPSPSMADAGLQTPERSDDGPQPRDPAESLPPSDVPTSPAPSVPAMCLPWAHSADQLRHRITDLEERLHSAEESRQLTEGRTLAAPEELGNRFEDASLLETFRRASAEGGFDVEIASVDCTEYPCIVYGHTINTTAAVDNYLASPYFAGFESDARLIFSWGDARVGGVEEERRYFGIVFYPSEDHDKRGEPLRKRLTYRAQQMWEAVRHDAR